MKTFCSLYITSADLGRSLSDPFVNGGRAMNCCCIVRSTLSILTRLVHPSLLCLFPFSLSFCLTFRFLQLRLNYTFPSPSSISVSLLSSYLLPDYMIDQRPLSPGILPPPTHLIPLLHNPSVSEPCGVTSFMFTLVHVCILCEAFVHCVTIYYRELECLSHCYNIIFI